MTYPAPLRLDLRGARIPGLAESGTAPAPVDSDTPPTLDRVQMRALNALLRRRGPLMLRDGMRQVAVHLRPAVDADPGAPWLWLTVGGAPAAIAVPWPVLRRVTGFALEPAHPEDAALLAEDALTPWLDAAETLTGLTLRLDRLDPAPPDLPGAVALTLGVETFLPRPGRQPLTLRLSPAAADRLAAALGRQVRPREALPQLALRVTIELDSLSLRLADLRGLSVGDALMLPQDVAPRPARAVVEARLSAPVAADGPGRWRLTAPFAPRPGRAPDAPVPAAMTGFAEAEAPARPVGATGDRAPPDRHVPNAGPFRPGPPSACPAPPDDPHAAPLRLTEFVAMTHPPVPPADPPAVPLAPADPSVAAAPEAPTGGPGPAMAAVAGAGALAALDDLELRVAFRLGEALMTVADLREAGIGTVVTLDRPDGAPVDIVVNGQVIGTGQIITVAGQRACQIATLFGDG